MSEGSESIELVDELFMEKTEQDEYASTSKKWHRKVALSTLLLALLAALGGCYLESPRMKP